MKTNKIPHYIDSLKPASDRLIFHALAGGFGQSPRLEGSTQRMTHAYVKKFMRARQKAGLDTYGLSATQLRSFEQLHVRSFWSEFLASFNFLYGIPIRRLLVRAFARSMQKKVSKAFQTGAPLLMSGGWTSTKSGHATFYEVIPQKDGTAHFRVYNLGGGVHNHPYIIENGKLKYQPYAEWKGISKERMMHPNFWQSFHEMMHYPLTPFTYKKTKYRSRDIYSGLKSLLKPTSETVLKDSKEYMTPQRSGTCAWRSLMATMRGQMTQEDYKRFKIDIKMQILLDKVKKPGFSLFRASRRRLIGKSTQRLLYQIEKLRAENVLTDDYVKEAYDLLKPAKAWIKFSSCRSGDTPFLGRFRHYKRKGNEIVIANRRFLKPKYKDTLKVSYRLEKEHTRLHKYIVNSDGTLHGKTLESNLYLAHTLGVVQEYQSAAKLLKDFALPATGFTAKEEKILRDICAYDHDKDGNAYALRCYAALLLVKKGSSVDVKQLHDSLWGYLQQYHKIAALHLSKDDEILLLKKVLSNEYNAALKNRLECLVFGKKQVGFGSIQPKKARKSVKLALPKDRFYPFQPLITRPHQALRHRFIHYYRIAIKGSPEDKQWLRDALVFAKLGDEQDFSRARLLEKVLEHPEKYPLPPKKKHRKKWWSRVCAIDT